MQRQVLLPQIELTMESVLIAKWLVRTGDCVIAQQKLVEVETQKATTEVPSPVAGYVRKLCVAEGQNVGERALLCILTDTADEPVDSSIHSAAPSMQIASVSSRPDARNSARDTILIKASPAARRTARELNIDIEQLKGTGPGERITEDDVRRRITNERKWNRDQNLADGRRVDAASRDASRPHRANAKGALRDSSVSRSSKIERHQTAFKV